MAHGPDALDSLIAAVWQVPVSVVLRLRSGEEPEGYRELHGLASDLIAALDADDHGQPNAGTLEVAAWILDAQERLTLYLLEHPLKNGEDYST